MILILWKISTLIWILWQGGISQYIQRMTWKQGTQDKHQGDSRSIKKKHCSRRHLKFLPMPLYFDTIPSTGPLYLRMRSLSSPTFAFLAISPWSWVQQSRCAARILMEDWQLMIAMICWSSDEWMSCLTLQMMQLDLHFFPSKALWTSHSKLFQESPPWCNACSHKPSSWWLVVVHLVGLWRRSRSKNCVVSVMSPCVRINPDHLPKPRL